jgi:hypothetical protein
MIDFLKVAARCYSIDQRFPSDSIRLAVSITIKCAARRRFDPCVDDVSRSDGSLGDNKYRFSWSFSSDSQISPHYLRTNYAFSKTYGEYSNYA